MNVTNGTKSVIGDLIKSFDLSPGDQMCNVNGHAIEDSVVIDSRTVLLREDDGNFRLIVEKPFTGEDLNVFMSAEALDVIRNFPNPAPKVPTVEEAMEAMRAWTSGSADIRGQYWTIGNGPRTPFDNRDDAYIEAKRRNAAAILDLIK